MKRYITVQFGKLVLSALVALGLLASPSFAAEYWMCVQPVDMTMPDATVVPMWGFAMDDDATLGNGCPGPATVPGPKLTVPSGDNTLIVHLRNDLTGPGSEPVSFVIPGQAMPTGFAPVFIGNRVRSFVQEAATNGGTQDYTWNNLQAGTYLYQSGTHPQVQVQMGLYGALTKNSNDASNEAYPGVTYSTQRDLFYSEVYPALHTAVSDGSYGTTGPTSTLDYHPEYFLLHSYDSATNLPFDVTIDTGTIPPSCINSNIGQGDRLLLRIYNAGLRELAPMLLGAHFNLVAEGGRKYPFARNQYEMLLVPGSTKDAIFTPPYEDDFKLIERRLNLTDREISGAGMQTCITVAGVSNNTPVVSISQPAGDISVPDGTSITFEGAATDVEDDDTALTASMSWSSSISGAFGPGGGGPFPATLSPGIHIVTASVTDSGGLTGSAIRTVTVTVTVPNVVGQTQANAEAAILAAGLTVGTVTLQSDAAPSGQVIDQDPAALSSVPGGSAVDLVVSTGPAAGNTAPVVTITNPSNGASFTQIDSVPFSGTAIDAEDGDISSSLSWTSSIDSPPDIGSGGSFSTTLSIGTHTITASATDSGGLPGSDSITVNIVAAASDNLTCKKADYRAQSDSISIEVRSDDLPKGNRIITGVIDINGDGFGGPDDYDVGIIPVKNPGSDVYRIVIQPFPDPNPIVGTSVFRATSDIGGMCAIPVN